MRHKWLFFLLLFFIGLNVNSQIQDTIILQDILVTDVHLKKFSKTQNVQFLNDSTLKKNGVFLSQLLSFNSPIYLKENGTGMTSSPAFRGTTAQQTMVLWNGIPVNSRLLGQSDFNAVSTLTYDEIAIKPGGSSVIYGSGAIGGTVHLNQNLKFNSSTKNELFLATGSFGTINSAYKFNHSTKKLSVQAAYGFNRSDNNYEFEDENYKNENGQYYNHTVNFAAAYKLNQKHILSLFSEFYTDERHFSLTSVGQTKTKYQNQNGRILLRWENKSNKFVSATSLAYLSEQFKYFENIENDYSTLGNVQTYLAKWDGLWQISDKIGMDFLSEFQSNVANGENTGIENPTQNLGHIAAQFHHQIQPKIYYELGLRKQFTIDFESPILFSAGMNFKPKHFYEIKTNFSQNFRQPTLNDLYWQPGGNLNLESEKSLQFELSQVFTGKKWEISATGFYNSIQDMIRWLPNSGGLWSPTNTDEVEIYGAEFYGKISHKWSDFQLNMNGNYGFTISKNKETGLQLTYTPKHKANANLNLAYKNAKVFWQTLFVSDTYSQTDNAENSKLEAYWVSNFSIEHQFFRDNPLIFSIRVNNIFNQFYQSVVNRPMMGRNFLIGINFKINKI